MSNSHSMPPAHPHRRLIERRLAGLAVGVALLFTGLVGVWRWGFDDAPWSIPLPPAPETSGWGTFNLYYWIDTVGMVVVGAMGLGLVVRLIAKRRGATAWIEVVLPVLICLQTAAFHAPFWAMTVRRAGRLTRVVEEPAAVVRALALNVVVTMLLAAALLCVTRLRRTPPMVRQSALAVAVVLASILLNLVWLQWIIPISNDWDPVDWRHPELMAPFRPCRGALLWKGRNFKDDLWSYPVGRIDDIWLHFADPATPGRTVWAVSAFGEWEENYLWLRTADVVRLQVRRDDPAVVHCDSRPRPERVAPESWHRMGIP